MGLKNDKTYPELQCREPLVRKNSACGGGGILTPVLRYIFTHGESVISSTEPSISMKLVRKNVDFFAHQLSMKQERLLRRIDIRRFPSSKGVVLHAAPRGGLEAGFVTPRFVFVLTYNALLEC